MKSKDEMGTPFDDGIRRGVKVKYADMVRAQIEHYEKHGYPTGTQTGPDPLDTAMEAAALYLARVKAADPDTLGEGDADHALRLHAELDTLREALDGGDVRHAARAGVAFGKALEEMRVRMGGASALKSGRASKKGGGKGGVKSGQNRAERSEGAYAMFRKYYRQEEAAHPELDPPKLCKRVAKFHGAKVHKQFECGTSPDTVARAMGFKK